MSYYSDWSEINTEQAVREDIQDCYIENDYDDAYLSIGRFIGPKWGVIKKLLITVFHQTLNEQAIYELQQDQHLNPQLDLKSQAKQKQYRNQLNAKLEQGKLNDTFLLNYLANLKQFTSQKLVIYQQRKNEPTFVQNFRIEFIEALQQQLEIYQQNKANSFLLNLARLLHINAYDNEVKSEIIEQTIKQLNLQSLSKGKLANDKQMALINDFLNQLCAIYQLNKATQLNVESRVVCTIEIFIEQQQRDDITIRKVLTSSAIADVDIWLSQFKLPCEDLLHVQLQRILFSTPVYEDYFVRFAHRLKQSISHKTAAGIITAGRKQITITKNFIADINDVISLADMLGTADHPNGYKTEPLRNKQLDDKVEILDIIDGTEYAHYLNKWMHITLSARINKMIREMQQSDHEQWQRTCEQTNIDIGGHKDQISLLELCINSSELAQCRGKARKKEQTLVWHNVITTTIEAQVSDWQEILLLMLDNSNYPPIHAANPILDDIHIYVDYCITANHAKEKLIDLKNRILQHTNYPALISILKNQFGLMANEIFDKFLTTMETLQVDEYKSKSLCRSEFLVIAVEQTIETYRVHIIDYMETLANETIISDLLKKIAKISYEDKFLKQQINNINRVDIIFNFIVTLLKNSHFTQLKRVLGNSPYQPADLDILFERLEHTVPVTITKNQVSSLFSNYIRGIGLPADKCIHLTDSLMRCFALSRIFNKPAVSLLSTQSLLLNIVKQESLFNVIKTAVLNYPTLMLNSIFKNLEFNFDGESYTPPTAKDLGNQTAMVFQFIEENCALNTRVQRQLCNETNKSIERVLDTLSDIKDGEPVFY